MKKTVKIGLGAALLVAGILLIGFSSHFLALSWSKLFVLIGGVLSISTALALFTVQERYVYHTSRIFIGLVFVFSGFVKMVDPLGSNYKFIDYFNVWNLSFMNSAALPLSFIMCISEFVVGGALLLNVLTRNAVWGALIFMVYFLPITFYLALQEQISGHELVHDCGCFGDALVISNWQTFAKNMILMLPTIIIFRGRKRSSGFSARRTQFALLAAIIAIGFGITVYSYRHLPLIDFMPYKIGLDIRKGMEIPAGAPQPKYETYLYYQKNGQTKEFTLENYPQDTTWTFVETKNILIDPGYEPPIHDFTIVSPVDGDITDWVLEDEWALLVIAYDLEKTAEEPWVEFSKLADWSKQHGATFRGMTATGEEPSKKFKEAHKLTFDLFNTDPVQLKTMVRANPGLMLLHKGVIVKKWHYNDMPSTDELAQLIK